jgi:hypothetical protein
MQKEMKEYEKVVNGLKQCLNRAVECEGCPYEEKCNGCMEMKADALALIEEMKAQLEQPTIACDYELTFKAYDADICKLNDKLSRVNVEYERTQCELAEAQKELTVLRAVKATTEAFLGVKIDG